MPTKKQAMLSSNLPLFVKAALEAFTDEEVEMLKIFFDDETKEIIGVGFAGPDGRLTKFGEPEKAKAIRVLEDQARTEYRANMQKCTEAAVKAVTEAMERLRTGPKTRSPGRRLKVLAMAEEKQ